MAILKPFLLGLLLAIGGRAQPQGSQPQDSILEVDENGLPIVQVTLGGDGKVGSRVFRFLLDTGASGTVLDTSVPTDFLTRGRRGKGEVVGTGDEALQAATAEVNRLVFGGFDGPVRVALVDLRETLGPVQDRPVDGILGMDVLRTSAFRLDFRGGRVEWGGRPPAREGAARIPIAFAEDGRPLVPLRVGQEVLHILCDTGASRLALALPERLVKAWKGEEVRGQRVTVGGIAQQRIEKAATMPLLLGEAPLDHPLVEVQAEGQPLLGLDVLGAGWVYFDFPSGALELGLDRVGRIPVRPLERAQAKLVWSGLGADRKLRVGALKPGGAYELAGARPGDEVMSLGPLSGGSLSRREAARYLTQEEDHVLVVKRGGVVQSLQVRWDRGQRPTP